jgi:deoxyribodipyrimidine photo-lyase
LIDWREGERYFMRQLVDGDFPSNNGGWQWSASVGTDAAPYFRIFNPATQGERFDADGTFVKQWIPELREVPAKQLFKAPMPRQGELLDASAKYPQPVVDHKAARERALAFFKAD